MKEQNIQYLIATLSEKNEWFSAAGLASYLHTTTRTVRNYINEINERYSSPVILTSHKGYRWNDRIKSVIPYIGEENDCETPEKRRLFILKKLMFFNTENREKELTIESLCDDMAISERTLMIDIEDMRAELKRNRLSIHLKKNALSVSGKETDMRLFIFRLISSGKKVLDADYLQKVYPALLIHQDTQKLKNVLQECGLYIDAYHINPFLLTLIIQLMRISNNHPLKASVFPAEQIRNSHESRAAKRIIEYWKDQIRIPFSAEEKDYLALMLKCMSRSLHPEEDIYSDEISEYAEQCIALLENYDDISYREGHFPDQLKDYMERLRLSCISHVSVSNPVRSALRNNSPVLHDHAAVLMTEFRRRWNLRPDADQSAFLEMLLLAYKRRHGSRHIPISCTLILPEYYELEEILKDKIDDHFHKLLSVEHIISTCNTKKLPETDLTLSVLPVSDRMHTVVVSPALTPEDYHMIQREISLIEQERRYRDFEVYLRSYSRAEFFERNHSFADEEDAVSYICERLEKEKYVSPDFKNDVMEREITDSTVYHHLIAVPHALSMNVMKNVIYVIANDRPVTWGTRSANIIVLVAMEHSLQKDFERFIDVLIRLFESRNTMKLLLEADDYLSFLERLEKIGKTISQI